MQFSNSRLALNPPHTYPHSAELLFRLDGTPEVGFVDTTNKLFTQILQAGDLLIFPNGLVHYQFSGDAKKKIYHSHLYFR